MPSLRSINKEAGTNFRRWKEVTAVVKEANDSPVVVVPVVQSVNCAKCGGTLHAEGNYPNLFRCGDCDTVQKLVPGPRLTPSATEPEPEPTEAKVREAEHVRQPSPDFPRKLSDRVAYQMRGKGFTVVDGWPVVSGGGTFSTPDETWKYDRNGDVAVVWEHVSWKEQRDSMYVVIIDSPLVRAGDGSLDPSMFKAHHGWIDNMSEYRQKKLDAVKSGVFTFAQDRVAWFQAGVLIYQTTIGALLKQSLILRG